MKLPTLYSEIIHLSRYARYIPERQVRESWEDTINRYFSFIENYFGEVFSGYDFHMCKKAVQDLEVMPSMRLLMTAGEACERDNIAAYNCAYIAINNKRAFSEALYILMNGTGVGFSCERQEIVKLPLIPEELRESGDTIVVGDSKLGWAKAYKKLLSSLWEGDIPNCDFSRIRPAGARLRTFGGRASGPEPLQRLFHFVIDTFKQARGRKLTSIEVHDIICMTGEVVVVGGVRRSALISLSNLSDKRMREAKTGSWWEITPWRSLSNNSAVYMEKPDVETFMEEWLSLIKSKSGERGIFNREASQYQASKWGRRDKDVTYGCNPCLHPDSMIETIGGRKRIADITEPTMVYSMDNNGKLCIKSCSASWVSKKQTETLKITIASGKVVRCTPDHKIYIIDRGWIEARDIKINDKVVHLSRARRGAAYSGVKLTTEDSVPIMEHRLVFEAYFGKIPDGYDIHHIDGDTYNNKIENLECLSHSDHARITALEQPNNHMITGIRDYSPGRHGNMFGFVSPPNNKFGEKTIVPMPEELKSNLHQWASVVKIEMGEITDVYDLAVEDTHNFLSDFVVVHNCSEIILRDKEFCNLTEVIVRSEDTFESLKKKVEIATILGTIQSSLTDFQFLSEEWKKNCEEERLLGVSLSGIMDHSGLNGGEFYDFIFQKDLDKSVLESVLNKLRDHARSVNEEWANKLGIRPSVAITCVKPSGTVSQLVDCASGIHPRYSNYYIRRIRMDKKDPIYSFLKSKGIPSEDDVLRPGSTGILSFPIVAPMGATQRKEISAIQHLELWLLYQRHWCEHKPSVTISVKENEWFGVGAWVYEHFDEMSGVSFLPYSEHIYQQAPYTDCTKEEYDSLKEYIDSLEINWNEFVETDDNTMGSQELACVSGSCEI